MISGLVLKYLNGECFVIRQAYETTLLASTEFNLTVPQHHMADGAAGRDAGLDEVLKETSVHEVEAFIDP